MSMFPIASQTVSSAVANISFTNIPQTFTHLRLVAFAKGGFNNGGNGLSVYVAFNTNTGNFQGRPNLTTGGYSAATTGPGTLATVGDGYSGSANMFGLTVATILDYTSTNKTKLFVYNGAQDHNNIGNVVQGASLWNSTAAITQIDLSTDSNWQQYSTFQLYGITTSPIGTL